MKTELIVKDSTTNHLWRSSIGALTISGNTTHGLIKGGMARLLPMSEEDLLPTINGVLKDMGPQLARLWNGAPIENEVDPEDQCDLKITKCKNCLKHTTNRCDGCSSGLEDPLFKDEEPTYYCNVKCQREDWPDHKKKCKRLNLRKKLQRAADFLQRMFFLYREMFFNLWVIDTWYEDDTLQVDLEDADWVRQAHEGPLFEFPASLIKDERQKKFLLSLSHRDYLYCFFSLPIQEVLKDLVHGEFSDIIEVAVCPKNDLFGWVSVPHSVIGDLENDAYVHLVLQVKLTSNEKFIVDITGPEFGIFTPVHHWNDYHGNLVDDEHTIFVDHFASREAEFVQKRLWERDPGVKVEFYSAAMFVREMREWSEAYGYRHLGQMVKLPEKQYKEMSAKLFAHIKAQLTGLSEACKNRIAFRRHIREVERTDPHWIKDFFAHDSCQKFRGAATGSVLTISELGGIPCAILESSGP